MTPKSILKILNYVNGLSLAFSKTKNTFKVMAVGNKVELEKILSAQFNIKDNANFLKKYFEEQIDIDRIRIQAMMEIANSKMFFENIDGKKVPINARTLERKYIQLKDLKEKYSPKQSLWFSSAVFYAFFVCDLFGKNMRTPDEGIYINDGYKSTFSRNEKDTKTFFSGAFFGKGKHIHQEAIRDIIDFCFLDRFEEWVSKGETKFTIPKKIIDGEY